MNIGLFGGTFDPIHHGHLALARAAKERFELGRIYFVPANVPPHKQTPAGDAVFPSLCHGGAGDSGGEGVCARRCWRPRSGHGSGFRRERESSEDGAPGANYSIDTVRRLKESLKKIDSVFFLIGIDAFAEIAQWHQAEALFRECRVHRGQPSGIFSGRCGQRPAGEASSSAAVSQPFAKQPAKGDLVLSGSDGALAGECSSAGLGDGDPGGGRGEEAVAQVCGCGGGGVHKEEGLYL